MKGDIFCGECGVRLFPGATFRYPQGVDTESTLSIHLDSTPAPPASGVAGPVPMMERLRACIDRMPGKGPQVVILKTDTGIDTSDIQREIKSYLTDKPVQIIQGSCHSLSRSPE